jgi:hypothetical protein
MPTPEDYSATSIEARLSRLQHTSGELQEAITGKTDSELSRRPDVDRGAARGIICHLRDVEGLFQIRFHTVVALDEPRILVLGGERERSRPMENRWCDRPPQGGIHLSQGQLTLADWVARLAAHDGNHVDQLHRALEGRP